jgi:hypothetical protein
LEYLGAKWKNKVQSLEGGKYMEDYSRCSISFG